MPHSGKTKDRGKKKRGKSKREMRKKLDDVLRGMHGMDKRLDALEKKFENVTPAAGSRGVKYPACTVRDLPRI